MSTAPIKRGSTSVMIRVFIQDATKSDGSGLGGLTNASSGLQYSYTGDGQTASALASFSSASVGTYTSGGFVAVDGTNQVGLYEIGLPNAMLAYAAPCRNAQIKILGAANMVVTVKEFPLVDYDPYDAVHLGLSALPNAAAAGTGGLMINGANTGTMTESYASLHGTPTINQLLFEIRSLLAENSVSGTTVTIKKIDGSTTAETFTIDSSTSPAEITRAS